MTLVALTRKPSRFSTTFSVSTDKIGRVNTLLVCFGHTIDFSLPLNIDAMVLATYILL